MQLQNPLWNFALAIYAKPEVENTCLSLQNEYGCSINRILLSLWLTTEKKSYQIDRLEHCNSALWHDQITQPIRSLRHRVRSDLKGVADDVYLAIRKAEFESERVEIAYLYEQAKNWPQDDRPESQTLLTNLQSVIPSDALDVKLIALFSSALADHREVGKG
jgi:uncharacterized protein (TIGR02444 family)